MFAISAKYRITLSEGFIINVEERMSYVQKIVYK